MLYCPNCGTKNKFSYVFCYRCGTKIKHSVVDFSPKKEMIKEFKINEFITLKFEKGKTVIYVDNEKFMHCKYLLMEIPLDEIEEFDGINSIDEAYEKLDKRGEIERKFSVETEFWGHCSNLQAWVENNYDTRLLHSNLAFPLLKKLTDIGDPIARRVFKDEVAERLMGGHTTVRVYLIQENYLEYFNEEEIDFFMDSFKKDISISLKKKFREILDIMEIELLMDLISYNIRNSQTLIVKRFKHFNNVDKETQLGFTNENKVVTGIGINRCGLTTIPETIGDFKNLKELYLTENRIKTLPKTIGNLKTLQKLNLSNNHLINIPEEIKSLKALKELIINHNAIKILPDSISKLENLEVLHLWGNQLQTLPESFGELKSLLVLGLSFNQLKTLPESLTNLKSLHTLDLSNNIMKTLPETIGQLKSLHTLWLNNTCIQDLPDSIIDITSLTQLYLINTPLVIRPDSRNKKLLECLEKKDINIWK